MEEEKDLKKILLEQIDKEYELNKNLTNAICNVTNSIKTIFQFLIGGFVLIALVTVVSYFFSPQDYTWNIEGTGNTSTTTMEGSGK